MEKYLHRYTKEKTNLQYDEEIKTWVCKMQENLDFMKILCLISGDCATNIHIYQIPGNCSNNSYLCNTYNLWINKVLFKRYVCNISKL